MAKIWQFLREVKTELTKVVWPTRQDTVKMTLLVMVFSLAVAVYLGAVDYGLTKLLELVLQ